MFTLWQHQEQMIRFALSRPFSLLYAGMSTGKTAVALEVARHHDLTCILAPVAALPVYLDDYERFYGDAPFSLVVLDRGTSKDKQRLIDEIVSVYTRPTVFVVGYETAARMRLDRVAFGCVIADEAQKIAAYNSKQALTLSRAFASVPRKVAMTGTAWTDRYVSLYGLFRFLDTVTYENKRRYPTSGLLGTYDEFLSSYCRTYEVARNVRAIASYKNVRDLADVIRPHTLIINTEDIIDLPDVVSRTYTYAIGKRARDAYDTIKDEGIVEINESLVFAPNVLTRMLRMRQIVSSGELNDVRIGGIEDKIKTFREIVNELDDNPFVVFCSFDADVREIEAALNRDGVSYSHLTGKRNTLQAWQDGETTALIANLSAGSAGVRLERAAHSIYWSLSFSATDFVQSTGRTRRVGQTATTVFHHYLVAEDTIDEQLLRVLRKKLQQETDLKERVKDGTET